jgi:hypothetical protein
MAVGRSTEPRSVTLTTTSASAAVTAAAGTFSKSDVGRPITATGIPVNSTLSAVASSTAATLSANATASGSRSATIGSAATNFTAAQSYGYVGWSPETEDEANSYTVAANNAGTATPDRLTNPFTNATLSQRGRG